MCVCGGVGGGGGRGCEREREIVYSLLPSRSSGKCF